MIDTEAQFTAKNRAMIARAKRQFRRGIQDWVKFLVVDLVNFTPGEGFQDPADTEYEPTGQLRGGYTIGTADRRGETGTIWHGGPLDLTGEETIQTIHAYIDALEEIPAALYITNNVAYGALIIRPGGRHQNPRPYPAWAISGTHSGAGSAERLREAMRGARNA